MGDQNIMENQSNIDELNIFKYITNCASEISWTSNPLLIAIVLHESFCIKNINNELKKGCKLFIIDNCEFATSYYWVETNLNKYDVIKNILMNGNDKYGGKFKSIVDTLSYVVPKNAKLIEDFNKDEKELININDELYELYLKDVAPQKNLFWSSNNVKSKIKEDMNGMTFDSIKLFRDLVIEIIDNGKYIDELNKQLKL